jgi:hypothetical protein
MDRRARGGFGMLVLIGAPIAALACGSTSNRDGFASDEVPARMAPEAGADGSVSSFGGDGAAEASTPVPTSTEPVDVVFTADNAYAFGWGDATSLVSFASRPNTSVAGDIFNCPVVTPGATCTSPIAHWMWYQPPGFTTEQAFTDNTSNATNTYLVFRVKAADIPVEPVK